MPKPLNGGTTEGTGSSQRDQRRRPGRSTATGAGPGRPDPGSRRGAGARHARSCPVRQLLAEDARRPEDEDEDEGREHGRLAPAAVPVDVGERPR